MTKEKFAEGWEILKNAGLNYKKEPTKLMAQTWFNLLKSIPDDQWLNILLNWIANETDFPTIAEILKTQKDMIKKIDVRDEIRKAEFGRRGCDPVVEEAVRKCGGWYRLGRMEDRDYEFALKDIEKRYEQLEKEKRFKLLKEKNDRRIK